MKPMNISPELAAVVGKGPMPRSEVVKALWVYIKKHNLQDPKAKRNIVADEALKKVFEIMGYAPERIEKNFGHMMQAFKSGTPPHGGIAWGFDRFMMLMENEPNIREVIAFAKTGEGKDLMMSSPSAIPEEQLQELNIEIRKKKGGK